VYVCLRISESPLFEQLKREGALARAPICETLLGAEHRKPMAAVLVVAAGMALSWYTA